MEQFRSLSSKPAFIIGVTGHMDLDPGQSETVKKALRRVFDWLRDSSNKKDEELGHPGLGLTHTPIILLSSLAPGADQWAAEVAREIAQKDAKERKHRAGVDVIAPLPFLKDQYLQASTFVKRTGVEECAKDFLADFADEQTFIVRLIDELELSEEELRKNHRSMLTGSEQKTDRDRRYLAAGEYVAAYSDILLALTDGRIEPIGPTEGAALIQEESPSAKAIAQRKLRGLMYGLLPTSPALGGSDSGPVIHIYATRTPKPNSSSSSWPSTEASTVGNLKILFPDDCRPEKVRKEEGYADRRWQKSGYAILRAVARNFERLNTEHENLSNETKQSAEFSEMLPNADGLLPTESRQDKIGGLRATLVYLAGLRRRVADYNRYYDDRIKWLKRSLFALAFLSAFFFAFAESWMPARDTKPSVSARQRSVSAIESAQVRTACFVTGIALTLASWVFFMWRRANSDDQRSDDYRAIAEGLRVQFYWTACGSGKSVASNYLQRQRGELGWIRCVISAAAFPYEPVRSLFKPLARNQRLALLSAIREKWVRKQLDYFTTNVDRLKARQAFFVHYSSIMLLAAFVLYILVFCFQNADFCKFFFRNPTPILARSQGISLCGSGLFIMGIFYGLTDFDLIDKERTDDGHQTGNSSPAPSNRPLSLINRILSFIDRILSSLFAIFSMFLPKRIESISAGKYLIRGALAVAITMLVVGTAYYVSGTDAWLPSPIKILTILRNLLLAGGVLCGVWVSANHLTENMRRYASMKSMFKGVDERFEEYLAACKVRDATVVEGAFDDIRLIIAVGREALAENADWLFTHRARPVEPVSA